MKKTICTVLLITILTMLTLPVCVSAEGNSGSYPQYISSVELANSARTDGWDGAVEAVGSKGCEYYLDYDFNKFSEGDYVILGYNRTDDESKAIRSLGTMFVRRGETAPETFKVDDIEYLLAGNTEFNSGTNHVQVYLYYSTDPDAGSPLKELYAEDNYIEPDPDTYPRILVNSSDGKNGELDYLEESGCDGGYADRCYLYRDYDKDYYAHLGESNDDAPVKTVDAGSGFIGSVFRDNPIEAAALLLAIVILLGGAAAVIIIKRRRKNS